MCVHRRLTCRQKGSSQSQDLWIWIVRKTVPMGSLTRCLQHGDQQLSSSWAVCGPPTRGRSLYHYGRFWWLTGCPRCQLWESEPFLDSWYKCPQRGLVQSVRAQLCSSLPSVSRQSLCSVGLGLAAAPRTADCGGGPPRPRWGLGDSFNINILHPPLSLPIDRANLSSVCKCCG